MTYYDSLYSYRQSVASGLADADLDDATRTEVAGHLDAALRILGDFGGTDSATLTRNVVSPSFMPWDVCVRVSDILSGCAGGYYQHRDPVYVNE